jgi:ferritin-like metal-binding protein YciE
MLDDQKEKKDRLTFLYLKLAKQEEKKPRNKRVEYHIAETKKEIADIEQLLKGE